MVIGRQASTRLLDRSILSTLFLAEQGFFCRNETAFLFLAGSNRYAGFAAFDIASHRVNCRAQNASDDRARHLPPSRAEIRALPKGD